MLRPAGGPAICLILAPRSPPARRYGFARKGGTLIRAERTEHYMDPVQHRRDRRHRHRCGRIPDGHPRPPLLAALIPQRGSCIAVDGGRTHRVDAGTTRASQWTCAGRGDSWPALSSPRKYPAPCIRFDVLRYCSQPGIQRGDDVFAKISTNWFRHRLDPRYPLPASERLRWPQLQTGGCSHNCHKSATNPTRSSGRSRIPLQRWTAA